MKSKGAWLENRCLGSTTVGPRGQVVIPVNARKELVKDYKSPKAASGRGIDYE